MPTVVFVAPFFMDATLRFIDSAASLPGVRLGLVSQDPEEKLPPALRAKLAGHYRIEDGLDPGQIARATRALEAHIGPVTRLIGTLEQIQTSLAQARASLGLPGMGIAAARNFRDKARMKTVFQEAGLPCARHRLAENDAEAWAFAEEVGLPLVAKPPAGAGAKNTFRLDTAQMLRDCLGFARPSSLQPLLLEEFIQGEEHSFDSVFLDGKPVWHSISRYSPTPLEVLQNPWIQWCVLLPRDIGGPEYDGIRSAAARALEALGLHTGLTHMEWFRRRDGSIAISEVAVRPPGAQFMTLISYAHDTDFYSAWARLAALEEFSAPERRFASGAAFLRSQGTGSVRAVRGLEQAWHEVGPLVVESRLPRPGQAASGTYEGEGYVILRHPETEVVEQGLQRVVSTVRVEASPSPQGAA